MKLIVSDLDGTLLNSKHEISKENVKALRTAKENGYEVAIATGRIYTDVLNILKKADIEAHIISGNGSTVHTIEGKKIKSWSIPKDELKAAIHWLIDNNFFLQLLTDKNVYLHYDFENTIKEDYKLAKSNNPKITKEYIDITMNLIFSQYGIKYFNNIDELLDSDLEFCCISSMSFDENKLNYGREYVKNFKGLSSVISHKYNFELVSKDASKGNALEYLAKHLNISLNDVIAFGDNFNDVSMFKKAGISVAMGNAENEVKRMCRFVTLTNNEDGVANFIYRHLEKTNAESTPA
ncbi:Cof-type HAD-IIB family hydrolase [Caloramator sp. ALD01]|uniref:Cof-type HAD-IIB family hydrolase n=1 Tax=Caloramator sp. ALD01 TaxID=1031288 RepID=UPI0004018872|nr:Cof-type HAD-IIB family hydrolase [Caloramator sp. ALD01]